MRCGRVELEIKAPNLNPVLMSISLGGCSQAQAWAFPMKARASHARNVLHPAPRTMRLRAPCSTNLGSNLIEWDVVIYRHPRRKQQQQQQQAGKQEADELRLGLVTSISGASSGISVQPLVEEVGGKWREPWHSRGPHTSSRNLSHLIRCH